MNQIRQANNQQVMNFYKTLFEGTNETYGYFLNPHTFSPIQFKEILLPYPFFRIIDSIPMRMANKKIQTATSYKRYPRMEATRLEHMVLAESLGVDLLIILEEKGYDIDNKTKIAFLVSLLTHDIGHGPFSHPFERMVGYKGMHEDIGRRALEEIPELRDILEGIFPGLTDMVVNFSKYDKYGLSTLLEGIFDLDRAAFLIMDTYLVDGDKSYQNYEEILYSVYNIFESIVLRNGKVYFANYVFKDINNFIKRRKENYQYVYQEPKRVLRDLLLEKLGVCIIEFSKTDDYKEKIHKLPSNITKEIEDFIHFIIEMKNKKSKVDLNLFYHFSDYNFDRVFYLLLLLDNSEINMICLPLISSNEDLEKYYSYDRNAPETGDEEFYVNNSFKIYKSTPEENITFIDGVGRTIDYKDYNGRFQMESIFNETLSFYPKRIEPLENEMALKNNLIEILDALVYSEAVKIIMLEPRKGFPADVEIIYYIQSYLKSIQKGISLEKYAEMCGISQREIIIYVLMCIGDIPKVKLICMLLLSDNIARFIKEDEREYPCNKLSRILLS